MQQKMAFVAPRNGTDGFCRNSSRSCVSVRSVLKRGGYLLPWFEVAPERDLTSNFAEGVALHYNSKGWRGSVGGAC